MEALRTAVVGTGFIGRVHARSARLAGARLVGVAGSSPASGQRAAEELGAEQAFASGEELVEADGIDVVHIATPNHLHEPLALKALAAGKHVVCEKPVALDGDGAQRIADAAAASGLVVTVPFVYRFHPIIREARARVSAGELGRIHLLHGHYQQDWLLTADDVNWRVDAARGGASRAFADIGSHWCDLVEFVSGYRIARLLARTATVVPERSTAATTTFSAPTTGGERRPVDTEDAALVLFETAQGALGSMLVSQVSAGRKNRLWFELDGEHAALAFDQENAETLWLGRRERGEILQRDPAVLAPDAARLVTLPPGHAQGYDGCFDLFVADTYAAIRGGSPEGLPLVGDGLRAARITDAVLESARSQSWIEVST
ncbi:MAG TPA: Gfo/Idh/MocA family oxidoreductase [Acidimicrobiales bacterium]|nr:Gfo/Idh/MocA family oxidoreductase [Acidimicrobiales bacterium]